jgi:CHAT domain-containing protein/tetratricopeptide (TPR) repeat protein
MSEATPCRVLLAFSLFLLSSFAYPVSAQSNSTPFCGLLKSSTTPGHTTAVSFGLIPQLHGQYADSELEARLSTSYDHLSKRMTRVIVQTLEDSVDMAKRRANPCAEALAAYALGIASRNNNVQASAKWFQQAEIGFQTANSDTGLAHTHFELVAATSKVRPAGEVSSSFNAVAEEFDLINDPRDALSARILAVNGSSVDPAKTFDLLLDQARTLHTTALEARIHESWGDILFNRGRYDEAMLHYRSSDELFVECRCDLDQRAYLQTSMGRIERTQGRPDDAIPHYQLALKLQRQSQDESFVPQTLNAIAVAYETMYQYPRAIAYVQRALTIARQIHSQQFIDFLEANLGSLYTRAGQPQRGLPLLKHATEHLGNDYQRCTRYSQLANTYLALHRPQEAGASINASIEACELINDKRNLADNLEMRARIRMDNKSSLDDALADAKRSLSLIEEIRSHVVPEDAHKRGYNQAMLGTYETTIAILARMNRYGEALDVTEQSRARAFLDLLSSPRASSPSPTNSELFVDERGRHKTRGGTPQSSPVSLLLESEAHTSAIQGTEILAQAYRLHTTLLAFWVTADRLYTWVIPPKTSSGDSVIFGISQPLRESTLESLIRIADPYSANVRGSNSPSAVSYPEQLRAWSRLYRILIDPIAMHLPTEPGALVTIVPHGPLFRLSFAALLDPSHHYLVEKYALNTIPAVGLLRYTSRNKIEAEALPPHYTLLAAPKNMPRIGGVPLPSLPGTAQEVSAIAKTLSPDETSLLEGNNANANELLRELPQATVIHFATHAIVSGTDPFSSFLALDREVGKKGFAADGILTAASIYALQMHARMVVLSACRTGRGPISADGVAGLARAFFYAGSESIVSSLWDVADQPTATLMSLFYSRLAKGESRAQALRLAQLDLIKQLRTGQVRVTIMGTSSSLPERPAYWAAFSLSGEP